MVFLIKLIVVHLIGDFFLQPTSWVKEKEKKKWKSAKLLLHVLIHGALTFIVLLPGSLSQFIFVAPIILISHWLVDVAKLQLQGKRETIKRRWFIADQLAHLMILVGIWYFFYGNKEMFDFVTAEKFWLIIAGILFLTQPTAILVKLVISNWSPEGEDEGEEAMVNAGKFIGILERLFVFGFIVWGYWEGIGFLLAAKSVFRFGDLNDSKGRNLTEYILIGTLMSFGIAILTGVMFTVFTEIGT